MQTQKTPEPCLSCQHETHWKETGCWPSKEAKSHWILFGCTCEPEAEQEAKDWFNLIAD
jgi:predicted acyl esterase